MFAHMVYKGCCAQYRLRQLKKAKARAKRNVVLQTTDKVAHETVWSSFPESRWAKIRDSKSVSSFVLKSSAGFFGNSHMTHSILYQFKNRVDIEGAPNLTLVFFLKCLTVSFEMSFLLTRMGETTGGMLLTYILLLVLIVHLGFSLDKATAISSVVGIILSLGLAFSSDIRCLTLMILPQLCSKRGRQLLLGYALVLTLTGPAHNVVSNARVLADSLHCGQEHISAAARHLLQVVSQPLLVLRDALKSLIKSIRGVLHVLHQTFLSIGRGLLVICAQTLYPYYRALEAAGHWLKNVVSVCNNSLGKPHDRCINVFEDAAKECVTALGPYFYRLCFPVITVEAVCTPLKVMDFMCEFFEFLEDTVAKDIRKKMKQLGAHIHQILYVSVDVRHSFKLQTNQSKTLASVAKEITEELESRASLIIFVFHSINKAMALCALVIFVRVSYYRFMFMTRDHFDNRFITDDFRRLDLQRARLGRETILPLTIREMKKYIVWWGTLQLSNLEQLRRAKAMGGTLSLSLKICIFLLSDYALYWLLTLIHVFGQFNAEMQVPPYFGIHVSGSGALARLYRRVVGTLEPQGDSWSMDSVPCLPNPVTPDFGRYVQIISLLTLCLFMAFFEPYALRMRHTVMSFYHPDRARQRTIWLYNHILRNRYGLLRFLRRQLRRIGGGPDSGTPTRFSCFDWLRARWPWTRLLIGSGHGDSCILCATPESEEESSLIRCATPGCRGRFCISCFADLGQLCTLCRKPVDYGDLSDMSEERGSSDEDRVKAKLKKISNDMGSTVDQIGDLTDSELEAAIPKKRFRYFNHRSERKQRKRKDVLEWLFARQRAENGLLLASVSSSSSESLSSSDLSFSYQYENSRPVTDAKPHDLRRRRISENGRKLDFARDLDFEKLIDKNCVLNPC